MSEAPPAAAGMARSPGARGGPDTSLSALLRLAWPIFVAQTAVIANGAIDTVMAGRLSVHDLAAVALGASIYITVYITLMGVLQALTPIAARDFGARRWRTIGMHLKQSLWLALFLSLAGLPPLLATDLWLAAARADAQVATVAARYLQAIALALPAALALRAFGALNVAVGRPRVTMAINLGALALKIPLNLLFMQGAGPVPAMGGAGCAVATATLAWLGAGLALAIWRLDPFYRRLHGRTAWTPPRWPRMRTQLALGIPLGLSTFFEITSFTLLAVLITRLGAAAVGGHQIVANLIALLYMVPLAIGLAASSIVAQCLGAGRPRQARAVALRGYRTVMALAIALAGTLWLLREHVVGLYTRSPEVASIALSLIGLGALFHVFDAAQGIAAFVLRAYRIAVVPMVIYGVALWGVGLGGGVWIAFHETPFGPPHGAAGFWLAAAAGLALAAIALTWLAATVSQQHVRDAQPAARA